MDRLNILKELLLDKVAFESYKEDTIEQLYGIDSDDIVTDIINDMRDLNEESFGIFHNDDTDEYECREVFYELYNDAMKMAEDEIEERYEDWAYQDEFETETMYY